MCMNSYDMNSHVTNSYIPLCVFVPDKELDCLIDSHVKLNNLDDTKECLSNSHHEIDFDYDEDTVSLVEESTLTTLETSISDNSASSAGNTFIAFEYHCYEIEDAAI
jgi:hypothetical protein